MFPSLKIWLRLRVEEFRFRVRELVRRYLRKLVEIAATDLDLMNTLGEVGPSVTFEKEHLSDAANFKGRHQLYRFVLSQISNQETGLFLEFGVYRGDSINRLAELRPNTRWYGFDSFEGLPEAWTLGAPKGSFHIGGVMPAVRENVTLTKGFFTDTLPGFVAAHRSEKIALVHIDCDLYSATKTVFDQLGDMMQSGCIIIFDELFNYPGWQNCEYKAFMEFIARTGWPFQYLAYVRTGSQVAVRLLADPRANPVSL
jgi:hypothetical protein